MFAEVCGWKNSGRTATETPGTSLCSFTEQKLPAFAPRTTAAGTIRLRTGFIDLGDETKEEVGKLRAIELRRLDMMLKAVSPRAMRGDVKAIGAALRISERRAKLLGLDAPVRKECTGADGDPIAMMTDEELHREIHRLLTKLGMVAPPAAEADRFYPIE